MQPQLIAGRYQVLRAIGRGGMGTVWLCRDEVLGREVAVKQIGALPGESATETKRAMREARSAAALNHPNAVAVYDVVTHEGRPWLVMEYVEGQTLADEIARDGMLSPQRVADIGSQLAYALARAHERLIVHRDIKPGNVLIDKAGRPKISDFGIARGHGDEKLTQIGFITGTPGFLSPELARGADPASASDVWALGATLYAAVEGQQPYEPRSNPIALLRAIATERPRPMTHAGALAPAIEAMMDADPALRWDMATSARRLGGIARITMRIAVPALQATQVLHPARAPEPTQALEPTQAFKTVAPGAGAAAVLPAAAVRAATPADAAAALTAKVAEKPRPAARAAEPKVVETKAAAVPAAEPKVVETKAAAVPAAEPKVVEAPVAAVPAAEPKVVEPRVAAVPVAAVPVALTPVVRERVAETPLAAQPAARAPLTSAAVVASPQPQGSVESQSGAPKPPSESEGSGRRWVPFVLVALLVAVLAIAFQLFQQGDQPGSPAGPIAQPSASQPQATQSAPQNTTEPPATTVAPPPLSAITASGPEADKKLEEFVKDYYSEVTDKRDLAWAQLSPAMQTAAGGRRVYDGWWRSIEKVDVKRVVAVASAHTVTVNLTYTKPNGSKESETRRFTVVSQGGSYLINSDKRL